MTQLRAASLSRRPRRPPPPPSPRPGRVAAYTRLSNAVPRSERPDAPGVANSERASAERRRTCTKRLECARQRAFVPLRASPCLYAAYTIAHTLPPPLTLIPTTERRLSSAETATVWVLTLFRPLSSLFLRVACLFLSLSRSRSTDSVLGGTLRVSRFSLARLDRFLLRGATWLLW